MHLTVGFLPCVSIIAGVSIKIFLGVSIKMSIPVLNFSTELELLVSRFACNTMMIVDGSSSPPVSHVKKL